MALALAAFAYVASGLTMLFVPGQIGPTGPSFAVYLILTLPVFPFAAYWAFSVRHALAVPLYRRQAFGIGFLAIAVWSSIATFSLIPFGTSILATTFQFFAFYFLFITLFYWIDASIQASRRSDPLVRDVLHWGRLRRPLWALLIVLFMIPIAVVLYVVTSDSPALLDELTAGTLGGPYLSFFLNNIVFNFPVVVPVCGLIYLPLAAARSKWDRNLRRHLLWFVPVSVVLLLIFFGPTSGSETLTSNIIIGFLVVFMGLSFYKSAKALVPLNRVSALAGD